MCTVTSRTASARIGSAHVMASGSSKGGTLGRDLRAGKENRALPTLEEAGDLLEDDDVLQEARREDRAPTRQAR